MPAEAEALRALLALQSEDGVAQVKAAHRLYMDLSKTAGTEIAKNVGATPDRAGRGLDCAVMNTLHGYRDSREEQPYDSIRGPFLGGAPIYPDAGFLSENHIKLCVRSLTCINGYFRPAW